MQYSQEHLKTMVYAKFGGANRVYYGELENRELFVSLLNVMHFEIRTDRNTVSTDRYSASILDNPPVGGGGTQGKSG